MFVDSNIVQWNHKLKVFRRHNFPQNSFIAFYEAVFVERGGDGGHVFASSETLITKKGLKGVKLILNGQLAHGRSSL